MSRTIAKIAQALEMIVVPTAFTVAFVVITRQKREKAGIVADK